MTTLKTVLIAVSASAALALAGCGQADEISDLMDAVGDLADSANAEAAEDDADAGSAADEGQQNGLPPLPVTAAAVGETVVHGGLEYTVDAFEVTDLDEVANRESRFEGASLVFSGSVVNPLGESQNAGFMGMLQWEDPETGHSFQSMALRPGSEISVPGNNASAPLEFAITLDPTQLETFEQSTALLLFGQEGRSRAQIPLGADAGELITRIPVQQTGLVDHSFDVDGVITIDIDSAELQWHQGNSGVEDGTGLLELQVTVTNDTPDQICWSRGSGANFSLVAADGTGTVDLGMSDRGCVSTGDSTSSWTGIPVHEPFAGEYTLNLVEYEYTDWNVSPPTVTVTVPLEFTMVEEPAVVWSERP